jgi:hypothetical protein
MPSQRGDWLGGLSGRAGGGETPRNQFVTFGTQRCYSFLFGCSGCWSFPQLGGFLSQQPQDRPPLAFICFRIQ